MKTKQVTMGCVARDLTSGFTGTIVMRVLLQTGTEQFALQPPMKEGESAMPDVMSIDEESLEYIGPGIAARAKPEDDTVKVQLGDVVFDEVLGIEATAVRRITYINGCVYFASQPISKKNLQTGLMEIQPEIHSSHQRLKVVKAFKPKVAAQPATSNTSLTINPRPGGPSTKARRAC